MYSRAKVSINKLNDIKVIKMKNILLTISTTALLLAGQSAMALNEDSSGYELINGNSLSLSSVAYNQRDQKLEILKASFMDQSTKDYINHVEAVNFLKAEDTHQ